MNPRLKKLLIEHHPDRHGGDHSRMEQVFAAQQVSKAKDNVKRCWCGVRINPTARTCKPHSRHRPQLAAAVSGLLALALCASVATAQPALPKPDKGLTMPKVQAVTPRLRTNGVQWLRWKPGTAPQQLIISTNRAVIIPDESYLARVSGLATGTKQTYVVTNEFGESNIAIATVFAETNRIEEIGQIYRVPLYPNLTNWLVSSTNLKADGASTWQPEKFLGTNGGVAVFFVTNGLLPQKSYKVLAY